MRRGGLRGHGRSDARPQVAEVLIPNLEVRGAFTETLSDWLAIGATHMGPRAIDHLTAALFAGDAEALEEHLEALLVRMLSYHDLVGDRVEAVYQAFIVGLLVHRAPSHRVYSNREAGFGRADVLIAPRSPGGAGVVMELKRVASRDTPARAIERAFAQLTARNYASELRAAGATTVHQYAVVFDGKRCDVRAVPEPA